MGSLDLRMDQGRPHPALSINNRGPSKGFVSSPLTARSVGTFNIPTFSPQSALPTMF